MEKVIIIPARYASQRLPGKPLLLLHGRPIIRWVYERAMASKLKDRVIIATDDERIKEVASSFGAEVVMTSTGCRSGTERVYEAAKDIKADIIVNLQGDEPFIEPELIDMLIKAISQEGLAMATICTPIRDESDYNDPATVKVVLDRAGFALYFSRSPIPFLRGEKRPPLYKHIGIYAFSMEFLRQYPLLEKGVLEEAESLEQLRVIENGYRIRVLVADSDGVGIDTEEDLRRAERLWHQGLSLGSL